MSDIFVSYKREDFARVERLVAALRGEGFAVWWDQDIPTGAPWEAAITAALDRARCVLVCWSEASAHPTGGAKVQVEARVANDAGKLIQVKLEPIDQPLFFRQWQAADLSRWSGDRKEAAYLRVVEAARSLLSGKALAAGHFAAALSPARKRRRLALGAAVAAAALFGAGAATIATPDAQMMICSLQKPNEICLTDDDIRRFDAALTDAKTRLAQRAIFYINDRRQDFPTMGWTLTQLAAPNAEGLRAQQSAYNARLADLLNNPCQCLLNGDVPHTISNAWMLLADANFGQASPATVIDAMLAGQSTEGWWSSTLDAADAPDNGATYATAFALLALHGQIQHTSDPVRAGAMNRAIDAGAGWLVQQMSREGWLADYPQSVRRMSNPGIDGEVVAALAVARPEVNLRARTARLASSMANLPPLWTQPSSDVLVNRKNGTQFYDQLRHISAAWTVLGAVSGMRDLSGIERARVQSAVRRVFQRDLESPDLFKAEWVAAEAIFALGETVERLKEMRKTGLGPRAEAPAAP